MSAQKGRPHHLLGYQVGGQRRIIVVQRIKGLICVGDLPADCNGKGKRYLIATGLKTCGELDTLIADYTSQIARLGTIPAKAAAVDDLIELAA